MPTVDIHFMGKPAKAAKTSDAQVVVPDGATWADVVAVMGEGNARLTEILTKAQLIAGSQPVTDRSTPVPAAGSTLTVMGSITGDC